MLLSVMPYDCSQSFCARRVPTKVKLSKSSAEDISRHSRAENIMSTIGWAITISGLLFGAASGLRTAVKGLSHHNVSKVITEHQRPVIDSVPFDINVKK